MAIASYNVKTCSCIAILVHHLNLVFAAEALAFYITLTSCMTSNGCYFLLTTAFPCYVLLKNLASLSQSRLAASTYNSSIPFVTLYIIDCVVVSWLWRDSPNEVVDSLARNGPYLMHTLNWIALEDLA